MQMLQHTLLYSSLLLLWNRPCVHAGSVFRSTLQITQNLGPSFLTEGFEDETLPTGDCQLSPDKVITFSNPASIEKSNRYYDLSGLSYRAMVMTIHHINTVRCGVLLNGERYAIQLQTLGDDSDSEKVASIGNYIANRTDFILAGYSSVLTQHLTPIAQANEKVLIAAGSSRTSVFEPYNKSFGILAVNNQAFHHFLEAVIGRGATRVSMVYGDDTTTCADSKEQLEARGRYDIELVSATQIPAQPDFEEDLLPIAQSLTDVHKPDVILTCLRFSCGQWIAALRNVSFAPKAQAFAVCGGSTLEEESDEDLRGITFVSSWDEVLPPIPDAVTGWTPGEFAHLFEEYTYQTARYQHVAAATSVSVLVQAIERANSLDSELVRQEIATGRFDTMYGSDLHFDENGQNAAVFMALQYKPMASGDEGPNWQVAYPPTSTVTGEDLFVYPMISWEERDCLGLSTCQETGGTCTSNGLCNCTAASLDDGETYLSLGEGATARCRTLPEEDLNYISDPLINTGIALFAIQALISLGCAVWTYLHREVALVKAAQPFFLYLVAFGSLVMTSSIIPSSFQGEYRYERDESTWGFTSESADDIDKLDAACMSVAWLTCMGFAILFSALFTKIIRVHQTVQNSLAMNRKDVSIAEAMKIMIIMLAIEVVILLCWQLVDPLRWERSVSLEDSDGFALVSVGECRSDNALPFLLPLGVVNVAALVKALWMCYVTRNVPDEYSESKWITISVISMIEICLLGIPVLVIADQDRSAFFFVYAGLVFFTSCSVCLLIFLPKMKRLHIDSVETGSKIGQESALFSSSQRTPPKNSGRHSGGAKASALKSIDEDEEDGDGTHANTNMLGSSSSNEKFTDENNDNKPIAKESVMSHDVMAGTGWSMAPAEVERQMRRNDGFGGGSEHSSDSNDLDASGSVHSKTPQGVLNTMLRRRGYDVDRFSTLETAYYNDPTELQLSSYTPELLKIVRNQGKEHLERYMHANGTEASQNPCTAMGESLIHEICLMGKTDMLEWMVSIYGAGILQISDAHGRTPLHYACEGEGPPPFDLIQILMAHDKRMFLLEDKNGKTPLEYVQADHYVFWCDFLYVVRDKYWERRITKIEGPEGPPLLAMQAPNSRPLADP
mmetsp:Transcript_29022/g.79638  ORF Transcript_29022/g.79638 Transcript_29022/m.79638 type:complete len:1127 (-) Transcript_29022:1512-4892(-)